jgi:hypothetical protein
MKDMVKKQEREKKKPRCRIYIYIYIYMRAVGYKKMLVNERASSPVFCGNEKTPERVDMMKTEELI